MLSQEKKKQVLAALPLAAGDQPFWLGSVLAGASWAVAPEAAKASEAAANYFGFDSGQQTVVVLADGLGAEMLADRAGYTPTLRATGSTPRVVSTTLPSTTAAALTGFATGQLPGATRMVGYSVYDSGREFNLLNFAPDIKVEAWQRQPTYFEQLQQVGVEPAVVTKPSFAGSGLTRAAFRGASFHGAATLSERFGLARYLLHQGTPLVYVYWSELDRIGHQQGPEAAQWLEALEHLDSELGDFLRSLRGPANVALTADHGMVEVKKRRDLADTPELREGVRAIAGEGRAVHLHAAGDDPRPVLDRWRTHLQDAAWVVDRDEMASVIGSGPGTDLVGDALVLMLDDSVIVDSRTQSAGAVGLRGVHGSVTDTERLVPVWRVY